MATDAAPENLLPTSPVAASEATPPAPPDETPVSAPAPAPESPRRGIFAGLKHWLIETDENGDPA